MRRLASLLLIFSVFFFLTPYRVQAAGIAFDTSAQAEAASGATSLTYAITVAASDETLIVTVVDYGSLVTSVTYNGVSLSLAKSATIQGGGGSEEVYQLANPATGSNNIVITKSAGSNKIWSTAGAYTGVKLTGQPDATCSSTGTGTSLSVTCTPVASNTWMIMAGWCDNGGTVSAGTGSTKRTQTVGYGGHGLFDSNAVISGSYSMTYTCASGGNQTAVGITLAPASSPTSILGLVRSTWLF